MLEPSRLQKCPQSDGSCRLLRRRSCPTLMKGHGFMNEPGEACKTFIPFVYPPPSHTPNPTPRATGVKNISLPAFFFSTVYFSTRPLFCCAAVCVLFVCCSTTGWEHISQFIAQATRAKDPFTKEDCIAKYQQIHAAPAGSQKRIGAPAPVAAPAAAPETARSAPERPARRESKVCAIESKSRAPPIAYCC